MSFALYCLMLLFSKTKEKETNFLGCSFENIDIKVKVHLTLSEISMTILSSLKFVTSKKRQGTTPVVQRRNKLCNKILEQIQLAQSQKNGLPYAPTRLKTFVNRETGERKTVEMPKRLRQWWHVSENGKINLICKYGSKQIQFDSKGKNAIEVANGDELLAALESLRLAIEQGELDAQIEATSGALRAAFLK